MKKVLLLFLVLGLFFSSCRDNSVIPRDEIVTVHFKNDPNGKPYHLTVVELSGNKEHMKRDAKQKNEKSYFRSITEVHYVLNDHLFNVDSITVKGKTVVIGDNASKYIGRIVL